VRCSWRPLNWNNGTRLDGGRSLRYGSSTSSRSSRLCTSTTMRSPPRTARPPCQSLGTLTMNGNRALQDSERYKQACAYSHACHTESYPLLRRSGFLGGLSSIGQKVGLKIYICVYIYIYIYYVLVHKNRFLHLT
jgi:hypothetical protein